MTEGGTNSSTVPAGGTVTYTYQTLGTPTGPNDTTTATRQTIATDRDGNDTIYEFNQYNDAIAITQVMNRGIDSGIPTGTTYTTLYSYDTNYRLLQQIRPAGQHHHLHLRHQQPLPVRRRGTSCRVTETPDAARGGDQSAITTTYTYEPIYQHVHTMTEPRGNDPSYVPQNGGAQSAARYTTTYTYDYQEGTNFAALGAILGVSASTAAGDAGRRRHPDGPGRHQRRRH